MFNEIIGFVTNPQFVIDAINLCYIEDLSSAIEDSFFFHIDMMIEMSSI